MLFEFIEERNGKLLVYEMKDIINQFVTIKYAKHN